MTQVAELESQGRWDELVGFLQKQSPQAIGSPSRYYYDLGTAAFRAGQTGPSVAYLEKARHLLPGNPDIERNLTLARKRLGQAIGSERLDPGASMLERIAEDWPVGTLAALLSILGAALVFVGRRGDRVRASIGAGALLLSLVFGGLRFGAFQDADAFLLDRSAVRSGPGEQYPQISQLEAGMKVRLVEGEGSRAPGNWVQVRAGEDLIGWVLKAVLLE